MKHFSVAMLALGIMLAAGSAARADTTVRRIQRPSCPSTAT
jgi:hypothetical protein